jgi:biopolymer transport protein TolR
MAFSVSGDPSHPQLNVTPLIDVLLVLIIIFMFIVSMSRSQGLEAAIPQLAKSDSPQPESAIVIQLHANAQASVPLLTINNQSVEWKDLKEKLQKYICLA